VTEPYPYPPLTPTDRDALALALGNSLGGAWEDVLRRYQQVLLSANQLRKTEVLRWLAEVLAAVAAFQGLVLEVAEDYARRQVPAFYARGVLESTGSFSWTQFHVDAAQSLAADSYDDLLKRSQEAGRTSQAFARTVRREVRDRAAFAVTARKTAAQVGKELAERLEQQGLSAATYANGAVVPMRVYTEMAVRTKTGVAHNLGALNGHVEAGVRFVEVFDGADCGWASHDDPDKPNGTVRHVTEAQAHLLSHPNCRRAFGARPDVTNRAEARDAEPSTTAAQRADQAASEGAASAAANDRAEQSRRAATSRRAQMHARRQQRLDVGGHSAQSPAVPTATATATRWADPVRDEREAYALLHDASPEPSAQERAAMTNYFGTGFSSLNRALREGREPSGSTHTRMLSLLQKATPLPRSAQVYRGVKTLPPGLSGEGGDVGQIISDPAWGSATTDPATARRFAGVGEAERPAVLEVVLPQGSRVLGMDKSTGQEQGQSEFVLPPRSQLVVESVRREAGRDVFGRETSTLVYLTRLIGPQS
jgi:hypothetical protein